MTVETLARILVAAEQPEDALDLLRQHVDLVNRQPKLQALRAAALAGMGDAEAARQVLLRALERCTSYEQFAAIARDARETLGYDAVHEMLSNMTHPQHPLWSELQLADMEILSERYEQAVRRLRDLEPKFVTLGDSELARRRLTLLGSAAHAIDDYATAERVYEQVLADDPNNVPVLNNLAYLLVEREGDLQRALELARRATQLTGRRNAEILDTLGWIQYRLGRHDEARQTLGRSVEIQAFPASVLHLAIVHEALGETERAREALNRAIDLARQDDDAETLEQAQQRLAQLSE